MATHAAKYVLICKYMKPLCQQYHPTHGHSANKSAQNDEQKSRTTRSWTQKTMASMADARKTANGNQTEDVTVDKTPMVAEEEVKEGAVVATVEETMVTTRTTTIATMVEVVMAMVEAVVAADIMGTTTSTTQTSNTVRPTSNNQRSNRCLNRTKSQVDNISHTTSQSHHMDNNVNQYGHGNGAQWGYQQQWS